jgi:hypothetical protein
MQFGCLGTPFTVPKKNLDRILGKSNVAWPTRASSITWITDDDAMHDEAPSTATWIMHSLAAFQQLSAINARIGRYTHSSFGPQIVYRLEGICQFIIYEQYKEVLGFELPKEDVI